MSGALTPRDRRTLLAGVTVIVSLLATTLGVPRYRGWRADAFATAEREAAALQRMERSIQRYPRTAAALDNARSELASMDSALLAGPTISASGTTLAAAISEAAEGADAELGSIQVRRDSAGSKALTFIGARASVSGNAESLALFLESLEAGSPLLVVREWSISGGTSSLASTQRAVLRMDVLVEGLSAASNDARGQ